MSLHPDVQISGDPEEVWLIEYVSSQLQPINQWVPFETEPALYTLEYNIEKICKSPYGRSPRLMERVRIRNVVTNEIVSGALFL